MKLLYSKKDIPYIETEKGDKIIFSVSTEDVNKGFKWLTVSSISTTTLPMSATGKKKKEMIKIVEPISFIVDVSMTKMTKKATKSISTPYSEISTLKKIIGKLVVDGYFPRKNLSKLETDLSTINSLIDDDDFLDEDPMGYYEEDDDNDEFEGDE